MGKLHNWTATDHLMWNRLLVRISLNIATVRERKEFIKIDQRYADYLRWVAKEFNGGVHPPRRGE